MVGTCANPGCTARFLYLHEGRLYVASSAEPAAIRYLWLCPQCAPRFSVASHPVEGVVLVRTRSRYRKPAASLEPQHV